MCFWPEVPDTVAIKVSLGTISSEGLTGEDMILWSLIWVLENLFAHALWHRGHQLLGDCGPKVSLGSLPWDSLRGKSQDCWLLSEPERENEKHWPTQSLFSAMTFYNFCHVLLIRSMWISLPHNKKKGGVDEDINSRRLGSSGPHKGYSLKYGLLLFKKDFVQFTAQK